MIRITNPLASDPKTSENLKTLVTISAKDPGTDSEENIQQISGAMEERRHPCLLAALLPLEPQVVVMGVAPLTTPLEGVVEALRILLSMDLLTVHGILTVHLEEVAPPEGVEEALQIGLLIPLAVEMGPLETAGVLRTLPRALHIGLPVAEIDAPVEKVVLLVGMAEDRRGILAPLNLRILNPEDSPL